VLGVPVSLPDPLLKTISKMIPVRMGAILIPKYRCNCSADIITTIKWLISSPSYLWALINTSRIYKDNADAGVLHSSDAGHIFHKFFYAMKDASSLHT
jgi:hypothetical protein